MAILERISTMLRANINAMLDSAEDPEIMLSQILRDMEAEIGKARTQVAEMMAQERLFRDDLKEEEDKARHLESRAEHYVRQGNDTMAREALKRKANSDANITVIQQQLTAQSEMVARLRDQLEALQEKHKQSVANRDNLLARYRRAKVQQQVTKSMSEPGRYRLQWRPRPHGASHPHGRGPCRCGGRANERRDGRRPG